MIEVQPSEVYYVTNKQTRKEFDIISKDATKRELNKLHKQQKYREFVNIDAIKNYKTKLAA